MTRPISLAALALATVGSSAQVPVRADQAVQPHRIAPARLVQIGTVAVPVQTGPWIPYSAGTVGPQSVTGVAFDLFEFGFDTNGGVLPGENPNYGASAGLGSPDTRYLYRPFKRNTMVYNDMRTVDDAAGVLAKRVAFAWEQTRPQDIQVFILATQNFLTGGDPNSSLERGDLPGVLVDFGVVQPTQGYVWADVNVTAAPVRLPRTGQGGYVLMLRTANNTNFADNAQFAMWGAKTGNPAFPQNPTEYQTLTNNNGSFVNPTDYIDTRFGTPVDPLGAMLLLLYNPGVKQAAASVRVNLGRLDEGDVTSLANVDGKVLRVCRFIVPNTLTDPINVTVESGSQAVSSITDLKFRVRTRMAQSGSFSQTVELFDWTTNSFTTGDSVTFVVNRTFQDVVLQATGNVSRYLQAGTNALRARYRVRATGPVGASNWCNEHDAAFWVLYQ